MNNYGGAHVAPSIHLDGAYIEVTPGTWKRWVFNYTLRAWIQVLVNRVYGGRCAYGVCKVVAVNH